MDRLRLREGQLVAVEVHAVEVRPVLSPELQAMFDEVFPEIEPALRYLADR
ncbi:MAG: hypothetical protein ACR2JY_05870 [Chloroflexota bacterium]